MTNKEAIEYLKAEIYCTAYPDIYDCGEYCEKCIKYDECGKDEYQPNLTKALKIAVKSLEGTE